jgi:hypothetical protein
MRSLLNVVHEFVAPRPVWRLSRLAIASDIADVTSPCAGPRWLVPNMRAILSAALKGKRRAQGRVSKTSTDDG